MLLTVHTITLGLICLVAFFYLNTFTRETGHLLRVGMVLSAGGSFGHLCTFYMAFKPQDYAWLWVPEVMFHVGISLVAVEMARGRARELIHTLCRRRSCDSDWHGVERRGHGD